MKNIYIVCGLLILLGLGIRLLYRRLKKAWLITAGTAVVTVIAWISASDRFAQAKDGEIVLAVCLTALFVGILIGECIVQFRRYLKNKKNPSENTSKGELS